MHVRAQKASSYQDFMHARAQNAANSTAFVPFKDSRCSEFQAFCASRVEHASISRDSFCMQGLKM